MSIILIAGMAYFIHSKSETLSNVINLRPIYLVALMACHFINFLLLGIIFQAPLKKIGIDLKFSQWFGLTTVSNLFNLFLPAKGGNAIRWFYLRDNNGLKTRTFLGINFLTTIIGMLSMGLLGFFFLEFAPTDLGIIQEIASESFFIMGLISSIILIFSFRKKIKFLKVFENIPFEIKNTQTYMTVFFCFTLITLLYPVRAYFSYQALGLNLSILQTTQLSVFLLMASLVPVLPGNIGIKEVVMANIASKFGIMPEIAIIATLSERASLYLMVLPLGLSYYFHLILGVKRKPKVQTGPVLEEDVTKDNIEIHEDSYLPEVLPSMIFSSQEAHHHHERL